MSEAQELAEAREFGAVHADPVDLALELFRRKRAAKAEYIERRDRIVAGMHALAGTTVLGDVIEYSALHYVVQLEVAPINWKTLVARWKKAESVQYGREYKTVPGVGYRLLTPDGRIDKADGMRKSANKRLRKALDLAVSTPLDALSPDRASLRKHLLREVGAELAGEQTAVLEQQRELSQAAETLKAAERENEP